VDISLGRVRQSAVAPEVRVQLSEWPENWADLPLAVLDVETTGFDPEVERVIEVAIIRFARGVVTERFTCLVNPGKSIPQEVVKLTGIADADVADAPEFEAIAAQVHARRQGVGIVAYNLAFDRSFLRAELSRCGMKWPEEAPTLDPLIFARQFFKNSPRKNLSTISKLLGIPLEEAHRAEHDAEVAGKVLYAFTDRLPQSLSQLLMLQKQWEAAQAQEMSSWKSFDGDLSAFGESPIGLGPAYIYGDEADPLRALFMSVPEAPKT